ncbi:MAG: thioesterase domain-containing protein [Spirochaetota bacterium]|nr:thioesterase domain-containing protein [Spirochaetota bacterium]
MFYYNSLVYEKDTIKKIANHISYGYNNDYKILFELNDCGKNKKISIICIPYAGGVGTAYQNLACEISSLNDRIALYSIALPGYDISYEETCGNFIQKIAIECVKEITNNISTPIIVYGNCAGSALALEISKLIQQTEGELVCVILGAAILISRTSNIIQFINPWKYISDKRIYKIMKNLGAFSEDVSSETLNIIIKKFRRDTDIAFKYFTEIYNKHDQVKLNVPIYNIIGNVDSFTKKYKKDSIIGDCFLTQLNLLKLKMAGIILLLISHL